MYPERSVWLNSLTCRYNNGQRRAAVTAITSCPRWGWLIAASRPLATYQRQPSGMTKSQWTVCSVYDYAVTFVQIFGWNSEEQIMV